MRTSPRAGLASIKAWETARQRWCPALWISPLLEASRLGVLLRRATYSHCRTCCHCWVGKRIANPQGSSIALQQRVLEQCGVGGQGPSRIDPQARDHRGPAPKRSWHLNAATSRERTSRSWVWRVCLRQAVRMTGVAREMRLARVVEESERLCVARNELGVLALIG